MSGLPIFESGRTCGECTACCHHLATDEPGIAHAAHVPCQRLSAASGCDAYNDRPKSCRDFSCFWLDGAGNEDDRPDRNGVIVYMGADHQGLPYVASVACRPGVLDVGATARKVLEEIGYQMRVTLQHFDGRREMIAPVTGLQDLGSKNA